MKEVCLQKGLFQFYQVAPKGWKLWSKIYGSFYQSHRLTNALRSFPTAIHPRMRALQPTPLLGTISLFSWAAVCSWGRLLRPGPRCRHVAGPAAGQFSPGRSEWTSNISHMIEKNATKMSTKQYVIEMASFKSYINQPKCHKSGQFCQSTKSNKRTSRTLVKMQLFFKKKRSKRTHNQNFQHCVLSVLRPCGEASD